MSRNIKRWVDTQVVCLDVMLLELDEETTIADKAGIMVACGKMALSVCYSLMVSQGYTEQTCWLIVPKVGPIGKSLAWVEDPIPENIKIISAPVLENTLAIVPIEKMSRTMMEAMMSMDRISAQLRQELKT